MSENHIEMTVAEEEPHRLTNRSRSGPLNLKSSREKLDRIKEEELFEDLN